MQARQVMDPATGTSLLADATLDFKIRFAILLPISSQADPISKFVSFARHLNASSQGRTNHSGPRHIVHIYLAIDLVDDRQLCQSPGIDGLAEQILRLSGFSDITTICSTHPRSSICAMRRDCVRRALQDSCDYYVLAGDGVEFLDNNWTTEVESRFTAMATSLGSPEGFGCVMLTGATFPGIFAYPVVHRTHLEIFGDEIVPDGLDSRDADSYLFQLYRHFGASTTVHAIDQEGESGSEQSLSCGWTFEILEGGKKTIRDWAKRHAPGAQAKLSLDVIVPSYRVDLATLRQILDLRPTATCTTIFIVIIDNPYSPAIPELEQTYGHRADVWIRVNKANLGASASRNRGLAESCAEWVAFFDDDVIPAANYLVEAERAIRQRPDAAGFIGNTYFPVAPNTFTTAIHLGGLTYFWNIADKIKEDIPWGVTANLIARRNIDDGVEFSLAFPKTGGGEDIDFCRRKRQASIDRGGTGFVAAPKVVAVHPWWNKTRRSYWRFYLWGKGDGVLIKMHPQLAWRDWSPNSAELILLSPLLILSGVALGSFGRGQILRVTGIILLINTVLVNILHDAYRHCVRDREHASSFRTSVGRIGWGIAVCEGALVRLVNETGRLVGILGRGEWTCVGKRFDWFAGGPGSIVPERNGNLQRCGLVTVLTAICVGSTFPNETSAERLFSNLESAATPNMVPPLAFQTAAMLETEEVQLGSLNFLKNRCPQPPDPSNNAQASPSQVYTATDPPPHSSSHSTPYGRLAAEKPDQQLASESAIWQMYVEEAKEHDSELVDCKNRNLDMMLLFATLFSAVLAAFIMDSRRMLQQDPADVSVKLLLAIAQSQQRIEQGTAQQLPRVEVPDFSPSMSARWINGLWYTALALSLAAALVAMLAKEWLMSFVASRPRPAYAHALVHQERLQGLSWWRALHIIDLLPTMLHVSLLLFSIGLMVYLWALDTAIAIIVAAITGVTVLFYIGTALLGATCRCCPFVTQMSKYFRAILGLTSRDVKCAKDADPDATEGTQDNDLYAMLWLAENARDPAI
ncbi:hypothetical protein FRC10_000776, partial [Ceratobasidium sp. 414]